MPFGKYYIQKFLGNSKIEELCKTYKRDIFGYNYSDFKNLSDEKVENLFRINGYIKIKNYFDLFDKNCFTFQSITEDGEKNVTKEYLIFYKRKDLRFIIKIKNLPNGLYEFDNSFYEKQYRAEREARYLVSAFSKRFKSGLIIIG